MNHCENYACKLTTCACICTECESAKSYYALTPTPCKTCGTCPTCGRNGYYALPYYPIYSSWWCFTCQIYHPFGYQCLNTFQVNPFITYTIPQTYTAIGIGNPLAISGGSAGITSSSVTWTLSDSSGNGNNNS